MEDFFNSGFGFHAGPYHFPTAGCTHKSGANGSLSVSAYKYHEEDPIAFSGGLRYMWRIGDYQSDEHAHLDSPKCYVDTPGPRDHLIGSPRPTTVTSYAWVYSWPAGAVQACQHYSC